MATKFLPFPPFEPDKSPFNPMSSDAMLNCLPVADGWKPMPDITIVSEALAAACVGAIFHKDSSGNVTVFAATQTNLYKLNTGSNPYTWDEVSKSTDAYSVPTGERAAFVAFGDYVFVNNLGTTPQKFLVGTDSAFSDNTDMPQAKYMGVAADFVICGHLDSEPDYVQWSGVNDGTYWTIGERGSDKQQRPGGGEVQGIIGDQRGAVIVFRSKMEYMQFAPSSGFTFTFSQANNVRGTPSPNSIGQIGPGRFMYYSEDGFFEGVQGIPKGAERVDGWFNDQLDPGEIDTIRAIVDPFEKIIWWKFIKSDTTTELIGYDWQLDRWCRSDQTLQEGAVLAASALTWDALDDLYATIDDASEPFDSRAFIGGRPTFAIFTTDNELAYLSGSAKAATLETASAELTPNTRSFVNGGRVVGDMSSYTAQIGKLDYHADSDTFDSAVSPSSRNSGFLSFRKSGRLHRARLNVTAADDWTIAQGIYVDFQPEGKA